MGWRAEWLEEETGAEQANAADDAEEEAGVRTIDGAPATSGRRRGGS